MSSLASITAIQSALDERKELDALRDELAAKVEDLALVLLGEPNRALSRKSEWRWGRKGSLALVVRGRKRGLWSDHENGSEGGDLFGLIRRQRGGSFGDAVAWARDFMRIPAPERVARRPQPQRTTSRQAKEDDAPKRIARAKQFATEAEPLDGTPAERYLTAIRSIERPHTGWPSAVRYHRGRNALLLVATDNAGNVRAVQFVYLTQDAEKILQEEAERRNLPGPKQTFGVMDGAAVRLPGLKDVLALAEGPETGLSVWRAAGLETWIALGGISKIQPPPLRRLVVCADDDPRHVPATKSRQKAIGHWRAEGREIAVAMPWARRRFDKTDFNDTLKAEGAVAVSARIAVAMTPPPGAINGGQRLPIEVARLNLAKAIGQFFEAASSYVEDPDEPLPIVHAIQADVGLGKSSVCRSEIVQMLRSMRMKGDTRPVVVAVPTHVLGDEQADDFENMPEFKTAGFRVRVWRGREAPDPDAHDYRDPSIPQGKKTKMCRDLDAVRDAQSIGLDPDKTACRSKEGECIFFSVCGYQQEKQATADIWIVPHELIFSKVPAAIGKIAALIVDEAAWGDGLDGVDGPPTEIALDALRGDVTVPDDKSGVNTERLRAVHSMVRAALDAHGNGNVRRTAMLTAGMDVTTGKDGHALSWNRVFNPGLVPGMPADERRGLVANAAENRTAIRLARAFKALETLLDENGPDASGWLTLNYSQTEAGPVRVLRLRGRRDVAKGWQVPTLLIDALLDPVLVRPYWPNVEVTARISAKTPFMRIRQMIGSDMAKTRLVPDDYASLAENERRLRRSAEVRAVVLREARKTKGRVLVVAQKAVREHWESLGFIPSHVEFAHHNAVAGRDEWGPGLSRKGVELMVVVGRTLPRTADVEHRAEALTGCAVSERASRYERTDAVISLTGAGSVGTEADRHPDPVAEAIRWQVCEGELIQILGRPRGVNRTAANPVDVLVLTDRPLPVSVDETMVWEELVPSVVDMMLNLGGVALESAADAADAYPNLWDRSEDAARKAFQRGRKTGNHSIPAKCGTFPNRKIPIGDCPALRTLATISYQRRGRGCRPETGLVDLAVVPDPKSWLEERLGRIAWCDLDGPEQPESPEPSSPVAPGPEASPVASRPAATQVALGDEPEASLEPVGITPAASPPAPARPLTPLAIFVMKAITGFAAPRGADRDEGRDPGWLRAPELHPRA